MMSFSDRFKENVNALTQLEKVLVLLEIQHAYLSSPIRVVNDNKDFIFQNELYLALPFQLERHDDVRGELPKVSITLPNAGRSLVKWIDASGGGRDAKITIMLARRSDDQTIEEAISLGIETVSITQTEVT